jgi:hypothetical protein
MIRSASKKSRSKRVTDDDLGPLVDVVGAQAGADRAGCGLR